MGLAQAALVEKVAAVLSDDIERLAHVMPPSPGRCEGRHPGRSTSVERARRERERERDGGSGFRGSVRSAPTSTPKNPSPPARVWETTSKAGVSVLRSESMLMAGGLATGGGSLCVGAAPPFGEIVDFVGRGMRVVVARWAQTCAEQLERVLASARRCQIINRDIGNDVFISAP